VNRREFVASIVSSPGWPVGAAVLVWMVRDQIRALLERQPTSRKVGPFEAKRADATDDVAERVIALGA